MKSKEDFLKKSVRWLCFEQENPFTAKTILEAMEDYKNHELNAYKRSIKDAKAREIVSLITKMTAVSGIFVESLPFLTDDEQIELNYVQSCGLDNNGYRTNSQAFLNTLGKGAFVLLEELTMDNVKTYKLIRSK